MEQPNIVYLYEEYDENVPEEKALYESEADANKACTQYNSHLVQEEWLDMQDTYRASERGDLFVDLPLVDIFVVPRKNTKPAKLDSDAPVHCPRPDEATMLAAWLQFLSLVSKQQKNRTSNVELSTADPDASVCTSTLSTQMQTSKITNTSDVLHLLIQDVNVWSGTASECIKMLQQKVLPLIESDTNILEACRASFPECEFSNKCMKVMCKLRCSLEQCVAFPMETPTNSYTVWRSQCGTHHSSMAGALMEIAGNSLVMKYGSADKNAPLNMLSVEEQALLWKWIVHSYKEMGTYCEVHPMTICPSSTHLLLPRRSLS
jgi:hypothetical protein